MNNSKNGQADDPRQQFDQWMERNRNLLPLNLDTWNVDFIDKQPNSNVLSSGELGKYNSQKVKFYPFYKPISRVVQLPIQDE